MTTALTVAREIPAMTLRVSKGKRLSERPIETLNQASEWWVAYRDSRSLSASTMPRIEIVVEGAVRAHVSYNGRVWQGVQGDWKPGTLPIYDPLAR